MTERRVLLAALLSMLCISLYSQAVLRQSKQFPSRQMSIPTTPPLPVLAAAPKLYEEPVMAFESETLRLEIGEKSGAIRSATLKNFKNSAQTEPLKFRAERPLFWLQKDNALLAAQEFHVSDLRIDMRMTVGDSSSYDVTYELDPKQPVISVWVTSTNMENSRSIILGTAWLRGDALSSRQNRLEAVVLDHQKDKRKYQHFGSPWKGRKNVPRGTLLALAERHFCVAAKAPVAWEPIELGSENDHFITGLLSLSLLSDGHAAKLYFGPRDFLKLRAAGFEEAFPIGILGQIGLVLLFMLSGIAGFTHSYGIALILFSILVTAAMAPFSMLGFRSMKRMQELKPQVDKIMAQHKNDPQKANKEIFELYRQNKVSPLGGCLPLLLQMPIFIALFQAMSHFIDLRGARFLKIQDLSLPDHLIHLPFAAPLVGNTVNVLPIIMAAAMYFQSRASQKTMGSTADNPTAQMMSGPMMPVLFLVMFYQFPAGLVLYWLTNSLMSMLWYRLASK